VKSIAQTMTPAMSVSMTEKMTTACFIRLSMRPKHEHEGEGEDHHREGVEEIGNVVGFS